MLNKACRGMLTPRKGWLVPHLIWGATQAMYGRKVKGPLRCVVQHCMSTPGMDMTLLIAAVGIFFCLCVEVVCDLQVWQESGAAWLLWPVLARPDPADGGDQG
jgi:hypothetical protein